MLETARDTQTILAVAVTDTHSLPTGEITGTTATIEIQQTTEITEIINKTGGMREITETNSMMTAEITGRGRKTCC